MKSYLVIYPKPLKTSPALTEMLWTAFASGAEGRNDMLQMIKDAGGIASAFKKFKEYWRKLY